MILGLWSLRIKCLFKVPGLQDSVVVALKGQMGWNREVPRGRPVAWFLVVGLGEKFMVLGPLHSYFVYFAYPNV